jgi:uncharacterized protein (DUF2235 family)
MPKNIVICCDGTANTLTTDRTNVIKLWLALQRDDRQIAYYDPGVGTLGSPGAMTGLGRKLSRVIDLATGKGVRQNVIEAYEYLMELYEDGDPIYLFGFSRGAYTVRALAGMLDIFGLLPRGSWNLVPYVWQVYSNDDRDNTPIGQRFKLGDELKCLNRRPTIRLLGVWDTVSSWGWFFNFRSLPMTRKFEQVEHIRHAIAIDERRAAFRQNTFDHVNNKDLQEIWFPGVHCDVGGGYTEKTSGLAKLALKWMFDEAESLGLRLDPELRQRYLGLANRNGDQYTPADPCADPHESLKGIWHAMEYLPRRHWNEQLQKKEWRFNLGRRRTFTPRACTAVHLSVGERHRRLKYCPKDITPEPA